VAIIKESINGKTVFNVFVKSRDSTGKQIAKRRRGITSEREAKRIEFDLLTDLKGLQSRVTWQKWSDHFLEKYRVEYRNSTYENYKLSLNKWITPVWKDRFLDEISTSDVHKLVFERIQGVASYTRRGYLKIIRRVFSVAVEEGLIPRNPATDVRVAAAESVQNVLNKNEIEVLLREAKSIDHRFYNHWAFAILTGMRSGELHALRWTDIDMVGRIIKVSRAWTSLNGEGPTKTAKNRVVPISAECFKFLGELKLQGLDAEYVLPRLWEWDQGHQAAVLKDFTRGLGISPIKFHDLRATFITQMLSNGVALAKVMAIVGHSSLKTTQGYLRLCGKDVEGATELLGVSIPEALGSAKVISFRGKD
jgi:integrase